MKIFAICGSLRNGSANMSILKYINTIYPEHTSFHIYNSIANLPHFNPSFNFDDVPEAVQFFRTQIASADAVIISTPEYAFGIPGSLKNALDWVVSSGEFTDKPTALITASSSGTYAHEALLLVLRTMSAKITDETSLLIPYVRTKVNNEEITDHTTQQAINTLINSLMELSANN